MEKQHNNLIMERTKKGNEVLKIVNLLKRFKEKYPKKCSESLEFVGIYDDKAVKRILNKILKDYEVKKR